jgi:hypothetical protein
VYAGDLAQPEYILPEKKLHEILRSEIEEIDMTSKGEIDPSHAI